MDSTFRCAVIGEGSLPLQCAALLLHQGHAITMIVTADPRLATWASERNIALGIEPTALLEASPFEYLFSIVNLAALADVVLRAPRRWAINYHDGLLPRYAGSNAAAWALLAGETSHGVTWHLMDGPIDSGDILAQESFGIAEDETTLSLHMKGYTAALRSFDGLITGLAAGTVRPQPQDLTQRTFFRRARRPAAAGMLDWRTDAATLARLVRALNYGPYPNPLGLPKVAANGRYALVTAATPLETETEGRLGSILTIEADQVTVATADGALALREFLTLDGTPLTIEAAASILGLEVGGRFDRADLTLKALAERLAPNEPYWVSRLADLRPPLLPYARLTEAAESSGRPLPLPDLAVRLLASLPPKERIDTLVAAFAAYLSRHCGQIMFDLGLRLPPGASDLCAVALPLRVIAPDRESFVAFAEKLADATAALIANGGYLRDLVARYPVLASRPELRQGVGFPAMIVIGGFEPDAITLAPGTSLTLRIAEDGLECRWIAGAALDPAAAACMADQFCAVLDQIAADQNRRIADVEPLTVVMRQQVLFDWNATAITYPRDQGVAALFAAQATRTPVALAVVDGERSLTYAALARRVAGVSRRLRASGVGPETVTALFLDRSLEMVIAILGVLAAGGAYLPLDPGYPPERLEFMTQDSGATLLLTTASMGLLVPTGSPPTIEIDGCAEVVPGASGAPLSHIESADPLSLAYMIYTSGSTGQPKAAMLNQRNLVNLALAQAAAFEIGPGSRLLQLVSPSFDVATGEMFTALLSGATLHLAPPTALREGAGLPDLLRAQAITHVGIPPAVLATLPENDLPDLALLITGGEPCPIAVADQWAEGRAFVNAYGPTETTVTATVARYTSGEASLAIGRPLANVRTYLLDERLQPVAPGVAGELYIAGDGVGRGYHRRPAATAERFLPDPWVEERGARMYRTGDWARHRTDGRLDFLGRIDDQVKLRGYRIELEEIGHALGQHPGLRQAVVALKGLRLVAYVISEPGHAPSSGDLHNYLAASLPASMVPTTFVMLETMPLTPTGKVDRRALPEPSKAVEPKSSAEQPQGPIETRLAAIMAAVLGHSEGSHRIGRHTRFFDLGGDSIASIRLVTLARDAGLYISADQVLVHQTVAALATLTGSAPTGGAEQGLVSGAAPLLPVQQAFFDRAHPDSNHWNSADFLVVPADFDAAALRVALNAVLRHHDGLRMRFERGPAGWRQICEPPGKDVPLEVIDLAELDVAEQTAVIEARTAQTQRSLDLAAGQLVRIVYFDLGDKAGRLLIVIHHLVVDIVAWRIVLEDLRTAYEQSRLGVEVRLPAKTTSLSTWAAVLTAHAQTETLRAQLAYWDNEQRRAIAPLPRDYERGPNIVADGRRVKAALRYPETQALLAALPELRATLNDLVLMTAAETVAAWIGLPDVLINVRGHGRAGLFPDIDLSRTVGWLTTTAPLLVTVMPGAAPTTRAAAIAAALEAMPGAGLGYGLLRYLATDQAKAEGGSTLPLGEINVNFLGHVNRDFAGNLSIGQAPESLGPLMSPTSLRSELLDVTAVIRGGRLRMTWHYSINHHREATIASLAQDHRDRLRALVAPR